MPLFRILDVFLGWFGYSPAVLLNVTAPRWGYRVERAIPYGPEARHRMDLYLPKHKPQSAPAVLFFYGGAFISGNKREYRFVGQALASKGIIVGIADYCLFPEPGFRRSCKTAPRPRSFFARGCRTMAAIRSGCSSPDIRPALISQSCWHPIRAI